ncbi:hypothetical protein IIC68_03435 [archaeon]|nr:hypothetical protein [archaeon]
MKIIVFALISLFMLSGCVQDQLSPVANDAVCVNEWDAKNLKPDVDYVPGEILIGFKESIPENQAKQIIQSYGLEIKDILDFTIGNEYAIIVHAEVEEGSEFIWICNLMENESVEYAELNGITGDSPSYVDFASCSEASKFVINEKSFPKDQIHLCNSEQNLINEKEVHTVEIQWGPAQDCPAGCFYYLHFSAVSLTNNSIQEIPFRRTFNNLNLPLRNSSKLKYVCSGNVHDLTEYKLAEKNGNFGLRYDFTEPLTCSWFEDTFTTITMENTIVRDGFEVTRSWEGSMFSYLIDGNVMWDYEDLETRETKRETSSFEEPL